MNINVRIKVFDLVVDIPTDDIHECRTVVSGKLLVVTPELATLLMVFGSMALFTAGSQFVKRITMLPTPEIDMMNMQDGSVF